MTEVQEQHQETTVFEILLKDLHLVMLLCETAIGAGVLHSLTAFFLLHTVQHHSSPCGIMGFTMVFSSSCLHIVQKYRKGDIPFLKRERERWICKV